jgi:hypothetical protein
LFPERGPEDGLTRYHGTVGLAPGQEIDVYYPAPFASPPNLETSPVDPFFGSVVVEQKADHFRIKSQSPFVREVTWQACGVVASQANSTQIKAVIQAESAIAAGNDPMAPQAESKQPKRDIIQVAPR